MEGGEEEPPGVPDLLAARVGGDVERRVVVVGVAHVGRRMTESRGGAPAA
jgi:hypothetical protein